MGMPSLRSRAGVTASSLRRAGQWSARVPRTRSCRLRKSLAIAVASAIAILGMPLGRWRAVVVGAARPRHVAMLPSASRPQLARPLRSTPRAAAAGGTEELRTAGEALAAWDRADRARKKEGAVPGGLAAAGSIEGAEELRWAARSLAGPGLVSLRLGIMAEDGESALRAFASWTQGLRLPGQLMRATDVRYVDDKNEPTEKEKVVGPVYLKYMYTPSASSPAKGGSGTATQVAGESAYMKRYAFQGRGVLFNPEFPDGEMRMYGDLPLALFEGMEE